MRSIKCLDKYGFTYNNNEEVNDLYSFIKDYRKENGGMELSVFLKNVSSFYLNHMGVVHHYNVNDIKKKYVNMDIYNNNYGSIINENKFKIYLGKQYKYSIYEKYCKNKLRNYRPERLDTRSLSYNIEKYGEVKGKEMYERFCRDAGKTLRVSYWVDKGYTLSEAKIKLSERQSTFSKKKCIEKYGV